VADLPHPVAVALVAEAECKQAKRLSAVMARVREEQAKLEAGEERILCELLFGMELEQGRMN